MSGDARPRFFVHVGLPKTGTTFLQDVFFASTDALAEQDLAMVPRNRHGHFNLALHARGALREYDTPGAHHAMERFVRQAGECTAGRALLTHEAFAPTSAEAVEQLLAPLERYDVDLVVTVRDLGRQIPSAWQQRVQGRQVHGYDEFLTAVRDRTPVAADFWRNQDLADVLDRWGSAIAPERIHVVTCPTAGASPRLLLERFCSVLGVDADRLTVPPAGTNTSLGHAQAELLRRVNVALGDRLPHSRDGYRRVGKTFLAGRILQPQAGPRPLMPAEHRPWVEELTESWIQRLREGGYDVVGDLDDLRSGDAAYASQPWEAHDDELLDVAVTALADILALRATELDEAKEQRRAVERLERRVAELESGGAAATVRRARDAVRRRLGRRAD